MNDKKGFTLIELMVVILIIAALVSIALPIYSNLIKKANEATLDASVSNINSFVLVNKYSGNFDDEHFFTYKPYQSSGGEEYLSRFLETEWEVANGSGDADNSNSVLAKNVISNKSAIVNWSTPTSLADLYHNQAVYITNSGSASYAVDSPKTVDDCYKGSVVIWYDASYASNIYIYSVDGDGMQSDEHFVISR